MKLPCLVAQPLEPAGFAPYGVVLGQPFPGPDPAAAFASPVSDFWQAHVFDAGAGGAPEILWVTYRCTEAPITTLEKHLLTQQALIPLTGDLVQVVARSAADGQPDMDSLAAFSVPPGQGICMLPGCWHATRALRGVVSCAMLTRRSTTLDLVLHLTHGESATESAFAAIPPHAWRLA